jgi:hypothetical protein
VTKAPQGIFKDMNRVCKLSPGKGAFFEDVQGMDKVFTDSADTRKDLDKLQRYTTTDRAPADMPPDSGYGGIEKSFAAPAPTNI